MIHAVADLTVTVDNVVRGYLLVDTAKKLGAKTFVHISFPRHMQYEMIRRRHAIMKRVCRDLGLKFVSESAPDPASGVGLEETRRFLLEKIPVWIKLHGPQTAFFSTNNAHTEPILKQVAQYGGFFIEPELPSPLMGYPGAFAVDLKAERDQWPAIMKKIEDAAIQAGGGGRMGTWAYSYSWSTTCALTELGKRVVEGKAKINNIRDLWDSYKEYTPGARWNGASYTDMSSGETLKNFILVYQDTYIFGRGKMNTTSVKVPARYFRIQ